MPLTLYKQSDPKWGGLFISPGVTMAESGCYITSLAMIDGRTPEQVLYNLKQWGAFDNNGLMYSGKAAEALGFIYSKIERDKKGNLSIPNKICIAETNHFANKGIPQHFFVWLDENTTSDSIPLIADPIDGKIKTNPYNLVSFRVFERV